MLTTKQTKQSIYYEQHFKKYIFILIFFMQCKTFGAQVKLQMNLNFFLTETLNA